MSKTLLLVSVLLVFAIIWIGLTADHTNQLETTPEAIAPLDAGTQ